LQGSVFQENEALLSFDQPYALGNVQLLIILNSNIQGSDWFNSSLRGFKRLKISVAKVARRQKFKFFIFLLPTQTRVHFTVKFQRPET